MSTYFPGTTGESDGVSAIYRVTVRSGARVLATETGRSSVALSRFAMGVMAGANSVFGGTRDIVASMVSATQWGPTGADWIHASDLLIDDGVHDESYEDGWDAGIRDARAAMPDLCSQTC